MSNNMTLTDEESNTSFTADEEEEDEHEGDIYVYILFSIDRLYSAE